MKTKFKSLYPYIASLHIASIDVVSRLTPTQLKPKLKPFEKFHDLNGFKTDAHQKEFEFNKGFCSGMTYEVFNSRVLEIFQHDLIVDFHNVLSNTMTLFCGDGFAPNEEREQTDYAYYQERAMSNFEPKETDPKILKDWYEFKDVIPRYHDYDSPDDYDIAWTSYQNIIIQDRLYNKMTEHIIKNHWMLQEKEYQLYIKHKEFIEDSIV